MEFNTPEAMKEYLHEHPKADKSNHSVKKPGEESKSEEKSEKTDEGGASKSKALFDAKERDLPKLVSQQTKDPGKLFKEAKDAHEYQLNWLNHGKGLDKALGAKVVRGDDKPIGEFLKELDSETEKDGPLIVIGPMKDQARSKEKVDADYGGDWSKLGDAVRASVAVDSMDQIHDVMDKLRKSGLKLARRPTDRFEKPNSDTHYRDLLMNVEYPNGHIGELQIHLKPVLQAKNGPGHKLYEQTRKIEAKAKSEGRDTMTPDEIKEVEEANKKARALYDAAWDKANGKAKNASTAERVASRAVKVAASTMYYDWGGLAASWTPPKFPHVTTLKGKERVVYELEKFFREAVSITEEKYNEMVRQTKEKAPS
jgi:hypothetical protein